MPVLLPLRAGPIREMGRRTECEYVARANGEVRNLHLLHNAHVRVRVLLGLVCLRHAPVSMQL